MTRVRLSALLMALRLAAPLAARGKTPGRGGPSFSASEHAASQLLLVPGAMQILHPDGLPSDLVAVIHGIGAALGGQIHVRGVSTYPHLTCY
jgi:hypothetical protein